MRECFAHFANLCVFARNQVLDSSGVWRQDSQSRQGEDTDKCANGTYGEELRKTYFEKKFL